MSRSIVMYARISDDKAGAGLGVARQQEDCKKLAHSLGITLGTVYSDNDVSAYSGKKRPGYLAMLEAIRAGRVDTVLAWHPDRLHRSPRELEDYIDAVNTHGTTTHFVKAGQWSLDTAAGRMTARIVGNVARGESEHKSERIVRAHQQGAERGTWRGGARPFGYAPGAVELDEGEATMIRNACRDVIEGRPLGAIIREWNDRGVTSTTGKPWSYATLRQVLLRPRNYGASTYRGEVVKEGAWAAIVDETTWRSVRAILSDPARRLSTSNVGRWLLPGLARCGKCEADGRTSIMRSGTSKLRGGKYAIYKCQTGMHLARRADLADEYVSAVIVERLRRPDAADLLRSAPGVDRNELQGEARGLRAQLTEAAGLYAEGVLTAAQLRTTTERLRERLAAVETRMVDPSQSRALVALVGTPGDVQRAWEALDWKGRREVLDALMTVTVLPVPPGVARRFSPEFIRIDWKA